MTATWMCLLVSGRLGLVAGLGVSLVLLTSCDRARSPSRGSGASGTDSEIKAGSLVCPDTAALPMLSAGNVPIQCPLLAVAVDSSRNSARLIGPADREYRFPVSALRLLGHARLPDGLAGATDSLVELMVPGPNAGVLAPQTAFGLLFRNASGTLDTLLPGDLPALQSAGGGAGDMEACLDALEASPAYGILFPPFAPDLDCRAGPGRIWKWAGESVVEAGRAAAANPGAGKPSQGTPWTPPFALNTLAKPRPLGDRGEKGSAPGSAPAAEVRDWVFLATADRHFIWRMEGGKAQILEAPFMENSEVESVVAAEVDGDSLPEILLEVKTHDGDGFHTTLYVLKGGPQGQADDAPRMGSIGLEGSYAETDGSTVASDWWIRSPHIYHAYAQAANPGGRGISHDTRLDAYGFSGSDGFGRTSHSFSAAAYFGQLGSRWSAQVLCDSLSAKQPEAARAGLRPLPRRTSDGLSWQAAALAPDLATAKRWAGWHPSGKAAALENRALQGR